MYQRVDVTVNITLKRYREIFSRSDGYYGSSWFYLRLLSPKYSS